MRIATFDYIERLSESGKKTARNNYKMDGFVVHHQSDIWAQTTPVGYADKREKDSASWGMWNMSGAWLCLHLYQHYVFNGDRKFLKNKVYPIFNACAAFIFDLLVKDNQKYCTMPSTSPENIYKDVEGNHIAICNTSAMDIGVITEFLKAYITVCEVAEEHRDLCKAKTVLKDLKKYKVKNNRLLEWDDEFDPMELGHRHFSMLLGLYPYEHLLSDYKSASKNALEYRLEHGSGSTGWSAVWVIALLARLNDGKHASQYIARLMKRYLHHNLFGAHPPSYFQIDANFGFTAAICELLLQDYDGIIRPLPTITSELQTGRITGLVVGGGHIISMAWEAGKLLNMSIVAGYQNTVRIALSEVTIHCEEKMIKVQKKQSYTEFNVTSGKKYWITEAKA